MRCFPRTRGRRRRSGPNSPTVAALATTWSPRRRGEIIGYAGLAAAGGQGDVQTIGVQEGRWGLGIGSAMLNALIEEAAARGCDEVFLEVRADNARAQRLYERFGFERVGRAQTLLPAVGSRRHRDAPHGRRRREA